MASVASVASAHRQGCSGTCQTQRRKLLAFSHSPLGAPSWGSKSSRPKPVSRSGPLASGVPARAVPFDYANVAAGGGKVPGLPRAFRAGVYSSPGLTKPSGKRRGAVAGKPASCRFTIPGRRFPATSHCPTAPSRLPRPVERHPPVLRLPLGRWPIATHQCSGLAPSARQASGSGEGAGGRTGDYRYKREQQGVWQGEPLQMQIQHAEQTGRLPIAAATPQEAPTTTFSISASFSAAKVGPKPSYLPRRCNSISARASDFMRSGETRPRCFDTSPASFTSSA